jgi:hypothetical protein
VGSNLVFSKNGVKVMPGSISTPNYVSFKNNKIRREPNRAHQNRGK